MGELREVLLLCWRDSGHPQGGGSERYLEHVGAGLAARGMSVTLRTARYPGAPRSEIRDGVRISRGGGRLTVYPRALGALLAARVGLGPLAGLRPDAVIDTQNGIPFFATAVTRAPVTVLVHHCHREQWPVAGRVMARVGWWIESWLSPRVHRSSQYVTVSLPSADELVSLGVDRSRVAVVRNGVDDLPGPAGIPATRAARPTLAVLSRLVPHKQIEDAIDAVAALRATVPDLHLDVIGGGWWEENLRTYARERGVDSAVTFHGHVSEERKHQVLARSWVHLLPSRKEGWGLAVIEAAQHGVPTVGYRHSRGLTDSVIDGVTGLLVGDEWVTQPDHRDVDELTAATATLLGDHDLRRELGEKARQRTREFSWSRCSHDVESVLRAGVAGRPVSGLVSDSRRS